MFNKSNSPQNTTKMQKMGPPKDPRKHTKQSKSELASESSFRIWSATLPAVCAKVRKWSHVNAFPFKAKLSHTIFLFPQAAELHSSKTILYYPPGNKPYRMRSSSPKTRGHFIGAQVATFCYRMKNMHTHKVICLSSEHSYGTCLYFIVTFGGHVLNQAKAGFRFYSVMIL